MFNNIFGKKEYQNKNEAIFISFDGKSMSEAAYLNWLDNAQKDLKKKLANEILTEKQQPGFSIEKMKQLGRESIQELMSEPRHFKSGLNDNEQIKFHKDKLFAVVKMVMHECGLSESELFTQGDHHETSVELAEKDVVNEPVAEISKPSYEQIEVQANTILELVKTYEQQYLDGVLAPMWEKYEKENDQRMKQLLYEEFISARKGYVDILDDDLNEIGESEYFEIAGAKADLAALRNRIASYGATENEQINLAA